MMSRIDSSIHFLLGGLLSVVTLASCSLIESTPGGPDTPRTLPERIARHSSVMENTIGPRDARHPQAMDAAAKYIETNFSDMGYAVTLQPVTGNARQKTPSLQNIVVYKPGRYSNNHSIVIGANYDSKDTENNGSGAFLLMEAARKLKDKSTNHNIYFVAYANGAESATPTTAAGAHVHAKMLRERIGVDSILGMINLEPQQITDDQAKGGDHTEQAIHPVFFRTTARGLAFASKCAVPFAKSWEKQPTTIQRETRAITSNDRHYAALTIPTVSCQCDGSMKDEHLPEYVEALTNMIQQLSNMEVPKPAAEPPTDKKAQPAVALIPWATIGSPVVASALLQSTQACTAMLQGQ